MKDHQESWLEYRPRRPRLPSWSKNTRKPPHSYTVGKRRYLEERSITYHLRAITSNNTARKKHLQTSALQVLRAMRSVFSRDS
jgi:hypothetical protein